MAGGLNLSVPENLHARLCQRLLRVSQPSSKERTIRFISNGRLVYSHLFRTPHVKSKRGDVATGELVLSAQELSRSVISAMLNQSIVLKEVLDWTLVLVLEM